MDIDPILQAAHQDTLRTLLTALDMHVPGEGGHAERVAVYSVATGDKLGLSDVDLTHLRRAAALHDIGKIAISKGLLGKLGTLSEEEFVEIKRHVRTAEEVLGNLPWMEPCIPMIRYHHERWDGLGYPDGLKGADIPIGARIIGVCETYDILSTGADYRDAMDEYAALDEIRRCAGTQFDPEVVEAFIAAQRIVQPAVLN